MNIPEPRIDPPETPYITGGCGHEIYNGEYAFEWEGRLICEDCYREKLNELTLTQIADERGDDYIIVNVGWWR